MTKASAAIIETNAIEKIFETVQTQWTELYAHWNIESWRIIATSAIIKSHWSDAFIAEHVFQL